MHTYLTHILYVENITYTIRMSLREIAFETEIPLVPLLDVVYVCVCVCRDNGIPLCSVTDGYKRFKYPVTILRRRRC